ncbi:MAG TPA: multiheme c-type cytochrome [Planctomycetaceae bacterium]|nr:multiheme c-type cytochrome [Planctomycetaceae bacterium]
MIRAAAFAGRSAGPLLVAAALVAPAAADERHAGGTGERGSLSCSTAACHGAIPFARPADASERPGGGAIRRDEYHVWLQHDPHARAYQALFSARSERMIERLARAAAASSGVEAAAEHYQRVWRRCLACHSVSRDPPPPAVQAEAGRAVHVEVAGPLEDGVGCEACHGSAGAPWFREHSRGGWRVRRPEEKSALGFVDTANLLTRARLCAGCHIGSEGRDVSHDLLAAGHPPLRFELAGYSDYLPAHWDDERERRAVPWFEWRLWAAGQVASSSAALERLRERAQPPTAGRAPPPWPEFSEYSCDGCHQNLALHREWRRDRGFVLAGESRRARTIPPSARIIPRWGSWEHTLPRFLAGTPFASDDAGAGRTVAAIDRVGSVMQAGLVPDPRSVVKPAGEARLRMEDWLKRPEIAGWVGGSTDQAAARQRPAELELDVLIADRLAEALLAEGDSLVDSWDVATQVYLMACAWERADRDERRLRGPAGRRGSEPAASTSRESLRSDLRRLRELLAFPPQTDSPAGFSGPADQAGERSLSRRAEVLELLRRVLAEMRRAGQDRAE